MSLLSKGKKIVAVARNFAAHARELNNPVPVKPVFFLKPTSSYIFQGSSIQVPSTCKALHHEVELGVIIGKRCRDIKKSEVFEHIGGYVLALDMTARDIQDRAKAAKLPWAVAKGYDTFCPVSSFLTKTQIPNPHDIELWLKVDGLLKQKGNTNLMLNDIPTLISVISSIFTLEEGDCVLTGTPEGVGAVKEGQTITAGITGLCEMRFPVVARAPPHKEILAKL
eukprot:TRINITY_DN365_c0_g1_i1.p1 TRINITY_DN365_c0_g1~~TRINITY_DN365_c0_g1_i1.p1  ORF type:complete len:224 (+),score=56.74 TRINITY_DN365_c0_g1_i1:51-722(+)